MSISIMSRVWKMALPVSDKMVLLALADAANDEGQTWIAVRSRRVGKLDLLTKCSLSQRSVQGAIKRLCDAGYLERKETVGKGVLYTLTPADSAPPQMLRPAEYDTDPGSSCGVILSNHTTSGDKSPSVARRRTASRISDDWKPTEADAAFAAKHGFGEAGTQRMGERFANYWQAKSGKDATKLDWAATWRNWVLAEAERRGGQQASKRPVGFV